jgi:Ca2+:H+ antiporter
MVLAVAPVAAVLSLATESVAHQTGDAVGGLLNATLYEVSKCVGSEMDHSEIP